MNNSVAIILINWNSFTVTSSCIESIRHSSAKNATIVLVDNASQDESGKKLKQLFPSIHLIQSDANLGFTGGNNLGLEYAVKAGYEFVFVLNNDTIVSPNFLEPLVHFMQNSPHVGAVQPLIYFNHNRKIVWNNGGRFNKWLGYTKSLGYGQKKRGPIIPQKTDWITGCAFFIRTHILEKTSYFAADFFMYQEDVDLSFRIKKAGYALYLIPSSEIYHIAGMSTKSNTNSQKGSLNPIVHYLNQRNKIWLLKKYTLWYCIPSVIIWNGFYFISVLSYFVIRGRFVKLKQTLKAIKHGIIGLK